jgi:hypothetical protein
MKTLPRIAPLLIFFAVWPSTVALHAWDYTGHMLVDQIAYGQTKPEVREKVAALVKLLDNKYNGYMPYNFVTAGAYMDDARADKNYPYSKWHYIDAPYTPDGSGYVEPEPPHVLWAIAQSEDVIKNAQSTDAQKAEAVAMILHFVGDTHQPLHCVDWNDKGGNGFLIAGVPFTDISKKRPANLHTFWDKAYRFDVKDGKVVELFFALWTTERPTAPGEGVIAKQAEKIAAEFPLESIAKLAAIDDTHAWAKESYVLACKSAYPPGPHPGDNEVVTLSPEYVHAAHGIADQRVALAGYRLANLLNKLFAMPVAK